MTRPRLWDEERVLDSAIGTFRAKGFEATTLRDVERATGLHTGSLYQAYGSKAGLFESVLSAYNERIVAARIERHLTSAADWLDGLVAFFTSTFEDPEPPRTGCLLTNSAIEAEHLSGAAREGVAAGLETIRVAFIEVLRRGCAEAGISRDESNALEEAADQLLALYQGLLVLVRFGRSGASFPAVIGAVRTLAGEATRPRTKR